MNKGSYILEEASPGQDWDNFVQKSPSGTMFSLSAFLSAVRAPSRLYWCLRGNEKRAAVAVMESEDGQNAVLHDFVIYNGLMFAPPANKQNRSQVVSEQFEIAVDVAAALSARYKCLEMALSPQVVDIRAFLWHNYGDATRYTPDVRYTAFLDISCFASATSLEENPLLGDISYARRQEVRKAAKGGIKTEESNDAASLAHFYELTMRRQNIEVDHEHLEDLRVLGSGLMQAGLARLFISRTAEGEAASMALFGFDSKRAYYLFGASDPEYRNTPCGTAVIWDSLAALSTSGFTEVDLEGVNSPRRGWFKLSFGARLAPYYQLLKDGEDTGATLI